MENRLDTSLTAKIDRQIAASGGGSGGGGGGGTGGIGGAGSIENLIFNWFDSPKIGGRTNEGRLYRYRYGVNAEWISIYAKNGEAIDFVGTDLGKISSWHEQPKNAFTRAPVTDAFRGWFYYLLKNDTINFRIKKGFNFVSMSSYGSSGYSDSVSVFIDGQTPSSLGLKNEAFNISPDIFNPQTICGTAYGKKLFTICGLDGEEHILSVKNTDSASKSFLMFYIDFGYLTPNYSLTNKIHITEGKTNNGIEFNEGDFSFDDQTYSGHCGSIVSNSAGILRALNGKTCATTVAKDLVEINFPAYPTSIKTRGIHNFPASGICSITTTLGHHYVFSYTGKLETSVQENALTGIIWNTTHNTPMTSGYGPDIAADVMRADMIINYLGTAPILITNLNNKIDFSITINGVTTNHTATIPNGCYSATLMDFNKFFNKAMQTAKPISGNYYLIYNEKERYWSIGASEKYISEIKFLFLSGANSSANIASTLGFEDLDYVGSRFYSATIEKNHSCCLSFQKGPAIDYTSPKIRFARASSGGELTNPQLAKLESFVGWKQNVVYAGSGPSGLTYFLPSKDAVGAEITLEGGRFDGCSLYITIDNRNFFKVETFGQPNANDINNSPIFTFFFTFPKGARLISWYATAYSFSQYNFSGNTIGGDYHKIKLQYIKELFCRPAIEELNKDEKIIKTFDISPKQFYENFTGLPASGPYVPQGGADPIKIWNHVGAWTQGNISLVLGYHSVYTGNQNASVDIQFVLSTDGGGFTFYFLAGYTTAGPYAVTYIYLSTSTINETTDLYATYTQMTYEDWTNRQFSFLGLKAGTYNVRMKRVSVTNSTYYIYMGGFSIIDKPLSQFSTMVTQMPLNFKSIPMPVNKFLCDTNKDDEVLVTSSEHRTQIDPLVYNLENLLVTMGGNDLTSYFSKSKTNSTYVLANMAGETGNSTFGSTYAPDYEVSMMTLGQNFSFAHTIYSTYSNTLPIVINGVTKENASHAHPIVSGGLPYTDSYTNAFIRNSYNWEQQCTFSSGIFNCPSTVYLKVGADIVLFDGINFEQVTILSITTNTSFTCTKRNLVVDANVTYFKASGYQPVRIKNTVASVNWCISQVYVSPLPISYSTFVDKFAPKGTEVAYANYKGVGTANLSFPIFKDGTRGNASNTTGTVTAMSAATTFYSFSIGSQVFLSVTGGTVNVTLISIRK